LEGIINIIDINDIIYDKKRIGEKGSFPDVMYALTEGFLA
jgi:hypothetical protein